MSDMKLIFGLFVSYLLVNDGYSVPIFNKLGNVGDAFKNLGNTLMGKTTSDKASPLPSTPGKEGTIIEQLEFLNKMVQQVQSVMANPMPMIRDKVKPLIQTLLDQFIPQFEKLDFSDDELRIHHKLNPDQILKFRVLMGETNDMFNNLKETMKKSE